MKPGFYWHVHHEILVEWCHDYDERAKYIRKNKLTHERKLRLRLFQPVKGSLPQEVIEAGQAYDQAWQAYDQARRAYNQAEQALTQAGQAYDQALQAYNQAWQAYGQAWQAYYQARRAYVQALTKNKSEIEKLHKAECPNCPWNGHTIFPG